MQTFAKCAQFKNNFYYSKIKHKLRLLLNNILKFTCARVGSRTMTFMLPRVYDFWKRKEIMLIVTDPKLSSRVHVFRFLYCKIATLRVIIIGTDIRGSCRGGLSRYGVLRAEVREVCCGGCGRREPRQRTASLESARELRHLRWNNKWNMVIGH